MSDLSRLFKKINDFYRLAVIAAPTGYSMPDDPEEDETDGPGMYDEIFNAARTISDADIAAEVLMVAEMYKKAVELNGGFGFVNQVLGRTVNSLDDEDNEEQAEVEDLLNRVYVDLKNRAKAAGPGADNDAVLKQLADIKNNVANKMIAEDLESDEPSMFEASLPEYQGGGEAGGIPGGVFDPTGGVSGEVAATKGRGYRVQTRTYKDWAQGFENERQRYMDELADPALMKATTGVESRRNTSIRSNLEELIGILEEMGAKTKRSLELEQKLSAAPDPNLQQEQTEVREELQKLQKRRLDLKKNLRQHQLAQNVKSLELELATARSPQEQFILQQKIELQKLMASPDKGKDEETKWRRTLINAMSGGHSLPADQIAKIQQKIKEGDQKKKKATELWRQKAENVAALKGTKGPVKTKQDRLEGGTKKNQYDFDALALDGLAEHLTQRMATERVVTKQKVTDKMKKAQQDPAKLKPFMDDVAKAATKKDKVAFIKATQRLRQAMEEFKNVQPEVVQFVISIRTSKFFLGFRDKVKKIGDWVGKDLSPEQLSVIQDAVLEGKKLIGFYKNLKVKPITPGWAERTTHYNPPVEIIEKIVKNLEGLTNG